MLKSSNSAHGYELQEQAAEEHDGNEETRQYLQSVKKKGAFNYSMISLSSQSAAPSANSGKESLTAAPPNVERMSSRAGLHPGRQGVVEGSQNNQDANSNNNCIAASQASAYSSNATAQGASFMHPFMKSVSTTVAGVVTTNPVTDSLKKKIHSRRLTGSGKERLIGDSAADLEDVDTPAFAHIAQTPLNHHNEAAVAGRTNSALSNYSTASSKYQSLHISENDGHPLGWNDGIDHSALIYSEANTDMKDFISILATKSSTLPQPSSSNNSTISEEQHPDDPPLHVLLYRLKSTLIQCRQVETVLRNRVKVEKTYGLTLAKVPSFFLGGATAGREVWRLIDELHQVSSSYSLLFSEKMTNLSDSLKAVAEDADHTRKQIKSQGRHLLKEVRKAEREVEESGKEWERDALNWERAVVILEQQGHGGLSMNTSPSSESLYSINSQSLKERMMARMSGIVGRVKHDLKLQKRDLHQEVQHSLLMASQSSQKYKRAFRHSAFLQNQYIKERLPSLLQSTLRCLMEVNLELKKTMNEFGGGWEEMVLSDARLLDGSGRQEDVDMDRPIGLREVVGGLVGESELISFVKRELIEGGRSGSISSGGHFRKFSTMFKKEKGLKRTDSTDTVTKHSLARAHSSSMDDLDISKMMETTEIFEGRFFGSDLGSITLLPPPLASQPGEATIANSVPQIVSSCIAYIESFGGLRRLNLYRSTPSLSGGGEVLQNLRLAMDRNPGLQLEEVVRDVSTVASLLKLFFQELKEPLFPRVMFPAIMGAAKVEDGRTRLIRIHEQVNLLDDTGYCVLKEMACHLARVASNSRENGMTSFSLSVIWGPIFFDHNNHEEGMGGYQNEGMQAMEEMRLCVTACDVIISNVQHIFE